MKIIKNINGKFSLSFRKIVNNKILLKLSDRYNEFKPWYEINSQEEALILCPFDLTYKEVSLCWLYPTEYVRWQNVVLGGLYTVGDAKICRDIERKLDDLVMARKNIPGHMALSLKTYEYIWVADVAFEHLEKMGYAYSEKWL